MTRRAGSGKRPDCEAPLPDQEARDAILAQTGLSMMVDAGAGSGKTSSIARRMVAVLRAGRARVGRMAAITFTRKAAGELRGRFQTELEKALREEGDPEAKTRLARALRELELVFTGTIHAFCARILRERPVEARVPPGFKEVSQTRDDALRDQAWDEAVERLHASGDPDLSRLAAAGVVPDHLRAAFRTICTYDEVRFPAERVDPPEPKAAFQAFLKFWMDWSAALPRHIPAACTCGYLEHADELREGLDALDPEDPAALADLLQAFGKKRTLVQKWWKLPKEEIFRLRDQYLTFAQGPAAEYLGAWQAHVYGLAMPILTHARDQARERRRREGLLNYQDLLLLAAEVLRENVQVRRFFGGRFTHLFVDEFQDTDPVQAEVMAFIAAEHGTEKDWTRLRLRPGALFVVGDPKQSIYRFRRADLATFREMRRVIEASGGRSVALTANFRSGHAVLGWLDRAFSGLFPAQETPEQPAHLPLAPAGAGARVPGRVVRLTVDAVRGAHREDAQAIARFIRHAVDGGWKPAIGSREAEGERPARYADFLILTAQKNHLVTYAEALEAYGIPFEASGGRAFSETPEVKRLTELAACLADPDDAVAAVGILRGGLFGVSDDDLYRHRKDGGNFRFAGAVSGQGHPAVLKALGSLHALHALSRRLPPAAALERLLEETGLMALAASGKGAGIAGGGVFTALERARAEAEAGTPFPEIARALAEDLAAEKTESAPLEPGRSDVVRLMNLHKAKGLEAPVVFLADPAVDFSGEAEVRVVREGGKALGYLAVAKPLGEFGGLPVAAPSGWDAHQAAEARFLEAERDRLRYVAATRARELLVISRPHKVTESGARTWPWAGFEAYLGDVEELDIPAEVRIPPRKRPDLSAKARESAAESRRARLEKASAPSFLVKGVTELSEAQAVLGKREPAEPVAGGAGKAWGTLVHGLLEAGMRAPKPPAREELERIGRVLALQLEEEAPDLLDQVPEAALAAEGVMGSALWQEARASAECHAEAPFCLSLPTAGLGLTEPGLPRETVVKGVIDLAYRVKEGWAIVDYKTDVLRGDPAAHAATHAPQLRLYAKAWERISGERVAQAGVFFVRKQAVHWLEDGFP